MKKYLGSYRKGASKIRTFPKDIKVHPGIEDGTFGCKPLELHPVRGQGREPSLLDRTELIEIPESHEERVERIMELYQKTENIKMAVPRIEPEHLKALEEGYKKILKNKQ